MYGSTVISVNFALMELAMYATLSVKNHVD